jgi:hypothetical protein
MASIAPPALLVVEDEPSSIAIHCPRAGSEPLASAIRHALRRLSESAEALEAEIAHVEVALRARMGPPVEWGRRLGLASLLPLLLLGNAEPPPATAYAQEQTLHERPLANVRIDSLGAGYQRGGSLGFALRDTAVEEELYRRDAGAERSLLWGARFVSRWALSEDQLDRWSAQVIGLLTDEMGSDVRLGGWERLGAADVGDRRVAYRYALVTSSGTPLGEATIVVFARGDEVGLSGTAAVGTRPPIDGVGLARLMDTQAGQS